MTPAEITGSITTVLAQQLNTNGIRDWLVDNAVVVILIVVALAALIASVKGNASKVVTIIGCIIAPLALLGFAVMPGAPAAVGRYLASLFGIGG